MFRYLRGSSASISIFSVGVAFVASSFTPAAPSITYSDGDNSHSDGDDRHSKAGLVGTVYERPTSPFDKVMWTLRKDEPAMRLRWIKDEDHWRSLPARAWPPRQPEAEEYEGLREAAGRACASKGDGSEECAAARFLLGTCMVFAGVDAEGGLKQFLDNHKASGCSDSAVGAGVVLVEGFHSGVPEEERGAEYLMKAAGEVSEALRFESAGGGWFL